MHEKALTQNTQGVLEALGNSGVAKDFYLAGGTALALYFGHRFSVDLDWFAEKFDYNFSFRNRLEKLGKLGIDSESKKTFNGSLNGVKVSFFEYPYPLISPKKKYKENIYLAGIPDIAVMKIEAIGSRGSYKDFIDIYFILKEYSLKEVLGFVRQKFKKVDYNETHLLKALTYFEDIEEGEMPRMIKQISLDKIKKELISTVKQSIAD